MYHIIGTINSLCYELLFRQMGAGIHTMIALTNTPHLDQPARDQRSEPDRIALCHEWLSGRSGSEKTFEAMAQEFPRADLFSLTWNRSAEYDFGGRSVKTTALDKIAPLRGRNPLQLPLMPLAWRYASRREYDVVVTSSHACERLLSRAEGNPSLLLLYAHALSVAVEHRRPAPAGARLTAPLSLALKRWDLRSVGWVDDFAGISQAVKDRIQDVTPGRPG